MRLRYTITSGNSPLSVCEVVGRVRKNRGQAGKPSECSPKTPKLLSAPLVPSLLIQPIFVFLPDTGLPFTLKIMKAGKDRTHEIKCV